MEVSLFKKSSEKREKREKKYLVCFICNSNEMKFHDVVSAIDEDQVLQPGQLYFVVPLSLLKHPLQAHEMAALVVKITFLNLSWLFALLNTMEQLDIDGLNIEDELDMEFNIPESDESEIDLSLFLFALASIFFDFKSR
ncbi:hypothetical protein JHK87_022534 [Glycine soja]|nr:hypothetical protein JHK87_022534 [Glycine soja]